MSETAGLTPHVTTIEWVPPREVPPDAGEEEPGRLPAACRLLDQTLLPTREEYLDVTSVEQMWDAIRRLVVRGAPAIGVAAGYGVVLGALEVARLPGADGDAVAAGAIAAADHLATSRPTAVNLFWALDQMREAAGALVGEARGLPGSGGLVAAGLLARAREIHADDRRRCEQIGLAGAGLVPDGTGKAVLTHCNTGALATAGIGTAFGVLVAAHRAGRKFDVYACETRPLLQGARLTAWELKRAGIPARLITDSTAAHLLSTGRVGMAVVGADRIAANGDTANKIGTYSHAVAAARHGVPFYIAAPLSTVDASLATGAEIPIEERGSGEITSIGPTVIAPPGTEVYAPAFDVTPADLIAGIITEAGVLRPPFTDSLAAALAD
jgi:methylthioribose-1-phosphate isomerase